MLHIDILVHDVPSKPQKYKPREVLSGDKHRGLAPMKEGPAKPDPVRKQKAGRKIKKNNKIYPIGLVNPVVTFSFQFLPARSVQYQPRSPSKGKGKPYLLLVLILPVLLRPSHSTKGAKMLFKSSFSSLRPRQRE